jgi:hypothetical protein
MEKYRKCLPQKSSYGELQEVSPLRKKLRRIITIKYVKQKGKVHRCTGTEALYRPYGKVHRCTGTEAVYRPYGKVHPCSGTEALYRP